MCGIAGFVDPSLSFESASNTISKMLQSISYRGPDARSEWIEMPVILGHNRLSILDLSKDGNQPMHFNETSIVFNGEIYNYIEIREVLKSKGYIFKTQSDTEVVLAAYQEYGTDCVKHFVGMWAFALWDKKKKELFCSRDRFGIKPFYYIAEGLKFYFGSEYKVLKQTSLFSNELNLDQVNRGLQLGWICYRDETYFSKIKSLPESCNLIFSEGKIKIEKYWDVNTVNRFNGSESEKTEKFRSLFLDSVKLHMRADVEVGGCLSGGLDSSAIASGVSVLFPESKFKTFTIFYEGKNEVDERPWVNEVLKNFPRLDSYTYSPSEKEVVENLGKVIHHAEVPIAGSSPISQFFVMKLAASHKIKVLLDGQGSDEYLAGYMHSFYRLMGGMLRKMNLPDAFGEFFAHSSTQQMGFVKGIGTIGKSLLAGVKSEQALYELEYGNYFPFLPNDKNINFQLDKKPGSQLNNFLYHLVFTTSLPSLLHYEDRNSMAFSIESRVPFLDHRLVEFVFSLEDSDKFKNGLTKSILRKSLSGMIPEAIINRKDKKGFVTPGEVKWLRGPLKHTLDIDYKKLDFLAAPRLKSLVADFNNGNNKNANLVWRVAMLNYWLNSN